ncbi:pyruvate, phosphate dikinase/phosphoenolpyruvate synthase regulator, partial [bacterium]|nr:pyruvate, phosphate dikinase/phosphoenolpyruvate synthase regulator [bacterium]
MQSSHTTEQKRTVFFISDSTGITAEVLGESLLAHFPNIQFYRQTLPFINNEERAHEACQQINHAAERDGAAPIVFDTLVDDSLRKIFLQSKGFMIDVIKSFLAPLEGALGEKSTYNVGRPKIAKEDEHYGRRIDAINFALDNDDGARTNRYHEAEVILIGVSRSGKTPTALYLALQFGIFPANYPLTDDDLDSDALPAALKAHKDKLFGLTIHPERLTAIRHERRANSRYASLRQCQT